MSGGMVRAYGGERGEGQHDIAERAQLDDQDALQRQVTAPAGSWAANRAPSSSSYTSIVACCIACVV